MLRRFFAFLFILVLATSPVLAADKSAFTAAQKAELETMIKDFITNHPEIMIASVEKHYNAQVETKEKQEGRLEVAPSGLTDGPSLGPKDAKVTVVEFFDYNCGYCKQVYSDVQRLHSENPNVRIVFKELPILSDTSELAARYALAADKQGKYNEFHIALMQHQGPITEDWLISTGKDLKLDIDKLKKDANSQDIRDFMEKDVALARTLGVRGTPFFVIGKEKVPGAVGYTQMKDIIDRELGVKPAAATSSSTTTTSGSAAAPAAAPEANVMESPEVQNEIAKARAETKAMIDEIKQQAADIQKQQAEAMKKAAEEEAKAKKAGAIKQ